MPNALQQKRYICYLFLCYQMDTKILIIGACGQIGTELTAKLRATYGVNNVIASDIRKLNNEVVNNGIFEVVNALDYNQIEHLIEQYQITDEYLNMVGLAKFAQRFPQQLSGGMKQRVAIARVLANECEVLLMDEPFGALDALTRESLQQELLDIWARTKVTVIFVTHSVEEAVLLSDRVVVMTAGPGRIEADIAIELARPREVSAIDFNQVRRDITQRLTSHVAPRELKAVA